MYNKEQDYLEYKKFKINNLFSVFSQQEYIVDYVKQNLMLLMTSGSYAYGMESENSDLDMIGIFKDNFKMILGYNKIDQIEFKGFIQEQEINITIYSLSKALKLIIEQNPNMLELIFVDESDILYKTKDYEYIRSRRKEMLSKLSRHKFTGYAMSQMKRIKGHSKWMSKEQSGKFDKKPEMIDYCRIIEVDGKTHRDKSHLLSWSQCSFLTKETNTIYKVWVIGKFGEVLNFNGWTDEKNCTFYFEENISKYDKKFVGLLFFAKDEFDQSLKEYNSWKQWKDNRNIKRHELEKKYNFDTKHTSHLFRLMLGGLEILEKETYSVKRPEKDFLLDIRNGKYSYEWVIEKAEEFDKVVLPDAYEKSTLKHSVDKNLYVDIMIKLLKI